MKVKKILFLLIAVTLTMTLVAYGKEGNVGNDERSSEQEVVRVEVAADEEQLKEEELLEVDEGEVVAKVNDEEVKGKKYNAVLRSILSQIEQNGETARHDSTEELKKQALDTIVNQTLLLQQAKEAKIQVSAEEIEEAYAMFAKQFEDEKAMEKEFESKNVDEKIIKEQIAESITFNKYQNKVVPIKDVTEKEIQNYYDQLVTEAKGKGKLLQPLEEIKKEIQAKIEQERQHKQLVAHIEELKKSAKIEVSI
ncbi:SurA N-terminal domain-containing protein [Sporosarcina ureilytica]|uniref:peptidylprolyl isomerase n=1 Tax=Sporosarcina ureilytica TaxID=298596 RepID=A0A1D8JFQ5_9BACL|nr:SurA N-terminal domain-containing protein [Sporosarcina ureilytica]AOV07541.1 hypothetical protein BI350_08345 [Sporosarcina ureilytica]